MKKYFYFLIASMFFTLTNAASQEITIDSIALLNKDKETGTKVLIRYIPPPKPEIKNKEFYSLQLGAFITSVPSTQFSDNDSVFYIINEEEVYVYLSGEYNRLNDAIIEKNKLSSKGKRNIYIVKVIDKRKIILVE